MFRPIQIFVTQLGRRFGVSTYDHTIDHTANKCGKSENQKYYTQNPVFEMSKENRIRDVDVSSCSKVLPNENRFHELDDNHKTQGNQYQT